MHIRLLSGFIFNISGQHWSLPDFCWLCFFLFFLQVVSTCILFCLVLLLDGFSSLIFIYKVFHRVKAESGQGICAASSLSLSHTHTQWNCAWDLNWVRTSVRRFSLFVLGEHHKGFSFQSRQFRIYWSMVQMIKVINESDHHVCASLNHSHACSFVHPGVSCNAPSSTRSITHV
jgi:hypothetical protein